MPDTQISTPFNIHQFVNDYEFRGDGGDHIPTDSEHAMLEDAITGALEAALAGHVVVPRGDEDKIASIIDPYRKIISDTPQLLSLLYDIDILPEQCASIVEAVRLAAFCEVWKMQDAAPQVSDTPVSVWRDIASAPKDGTQILLWFPWTYSKSPHAPEGFIYIGKWHSPDDGKDGWHDPVDYEEIGKEPALWQPLPAAPPVSRGE